MVSMLRSRTVAEQVMDAQEGLIGVRELADECRVEISRYEPRLQAWVELTDLDQEVSASEGSDNRDDNRDAVDDKPLRGLSVAVKDIIDVAGLPTRCGSHTTSEAPATADAACVARLRELGAVVQGKTVTTEFGYFSPGPTTNPFDENRTPGGSSSGSAAAVGAGTIPFALGTQTAGSLTRPASFCGAAGLVTTPGSTAMDGIAGLSHTLDSLGLLASTANDLDFVYRRFAGRADEEATDPAQLTAFMWDGSGILNLDTNMAELLRMVRQLLEDICASTTTLNWDDHIRSLVDDHKLIMAYEAARSLGVELGASRSEVSPQLQQLFDTGDQTDESTYREALFRREVSRTALTRVAGPEFVIIGPAAQGAAGEIGVGTGSPDLSRPWQLLGLPAVTVPGAHTSTGLPLGIQLIGPENSEPTLLRLAKELEPLLRKLPSFSENEPPSVLKEMKW